MVWIFTSLKEKKGNEIQIVDTIIEDFSTSIALKLASKNTLGELIDSEIYTILSENSKDQILKLDNNYDLLTNNTKENQKKNKRKKVCIIEIASFYFFLQKYSFENN